jgi:hypothetical protein
VRVACQSTYLTLTFSRRLAPKVSTSDTAPKKGRPASVASGGSSTGEIFTGQSAEECQKFVRNVWLTAFNRGKESDNYWKARFAASCFRGPALGWYEALDIKTKNDWELLRSAIQSLFPTVRDDRFASISIHGRCANICYPQKVIRS